jgi:hypothetical protein
MVRWRVDKDEIARRNFTFPLMIIMRIISSRCLELVNHTQYNDTNGI